MAAFVGVPKQTLYVWRAQSKGPRGIRVGKHLRYRWSDVDAWLDEQADHPRVGVA
ncbi:helix-turn-helix transcriptional regulator [Modestobacter sp. URMC 112]